MKSEIFQIDLDCSIASELRNVVTSELNISLNMKQSLKIADRHKEYFTWEASCAIMDRLEDTVQYLNGLKLNTGIHRRSAFDFFDFMNQASVIVDCIDMLADIYCISLAETNESTDIFNQPGSNSRGNDKKYFAYLRSLCSVHPIKTSRHRHTYQDSDFESSPYAIWNDGHIWADDDCDIHVIVYTNNKDMQLKRLGVKMQEIFQYVKFRYELLIGINTQIKKYHLQKKMAYANTLMKTENDFADYVDYLKYLKACAEERFGKNESYVLEYAIALFSLELSNHHNNQRLEKYINAVKYAIGFEHNALQNMSHQGFKNCGIEYPEANIETTLLIEIAYANSRGEERSKYHYNLEKIGYLNDDCDYYQRQEAYFMIEQAKTFFEKYIDFDKASSDFEHYALVNIALYFDCLNHKCMLNRNIPNDLKYRDQILTEEELIDLRTVDIINENASENLLKFIKSKTNEWCE